MGLLWLSEPLYGKAGIATRLQPKHRGTEKTEMMTCPDCGRNLDDVPVGDLCPSCGGNRRAAVVSPAPVEVVTTVESVSYKITKGDNRPWTEKWRLMLHHRDSLARSYAGEDRQGNIEAESRAMDFFAECDHLREWLEHDSALGLNRGDIEAHFQSSSALRACNAICNTHKHHTRRSGTTARIREVNVHPEGVQVTIEVDWTMPSASAVDALNLADECVASWRSFFVANRIIEP
jgi:hypothetical protein